MVSDQSKKHLQVENEQSPIDKNTDIREVVLQMEREYYKQQKEKEETLELKRRHNLLKLVR